MRGSFVQVLHFHCLHCLHAILKSVSVSARLLVRVHRSNLPGCLALGTLPVHVPLTPTRGATTLPMAASFSAAPLRIAVMVGRKSRGWLAGAGCGLGSDVRCGDVLAVLRLPVHLEHRVQLCGVDRLGMAGAACQWLTPVVRASG